MIRVLVIDDEEVLARTICNYLRKRDVEAEYVLDGNDGVAKFALLRPDVTFLDFRIGRDDGLEVLGRLHARNRDARIIMMTGHGDITTAVEAMKAGATDFMTKPVPLSTIARLVLPKSGSAPTLPHSAEGERVAPLDLCEAIVGRSGAADRIRSSVVRILQAVGSLKSALPPVIITGESGTGKELVARALHEHGPRAGKPFVAINCAALPPELVESELFGHEKGAFTDARVQKKGLFEAASGGILFLDEIGDMPLDAQAKLLRVLESGSARRVGALQEHELDVWLVAATNHNLAEKVAAGAFRADLMYRLQVLWLDLPPLRERDSDVLALAGYFMDRAAKRYGMETPVLSSDAGSKLVAHEWPGNIRELRNVMERAVLVAGTHELCATDIGITDLACMPTPRSSGGTTLREIEIETLKNALLSSGGNVSRAADVLGISRDTLRYRMQKFGLGRHTG